MVAATQTQSKPRTSEGIPAAAINLEHLPDDALLKPRDFCALTSWSSSTLKRKWQDGTIPMPIRLGQNSLRWRAADVRATLSRLACRRLHSQPNLASV
jgi:predicted DNA-binding transcriptional regulator AlpA